MPSAENTSDASYNVADDILRDLSDRSGIGDAIDGCDQDIKTEIRESIAQIVRCYFQAEEHWRKR